MTDKVISSNCKSVRTITLQRPKKKNALDAEMFDELTHQLRQAADAQEVKVDADVDVDVDVAADAQEVKAEVLEAKMGDF